MVRRHARILLGRQQRQGSRPSAWNTSPIPQGAPEYIPYVPIAARSGVAGAVRAEYKGRIDEQFAFLAFRTAPLVSAATMDAKVVTADMASRMMVWAEIGKPNQREWVPVRVERNTAVQERGPIFVRISSVRGGTPSETSCWRFVRMSGLGKPANPRAEDHLRGAVLSEPSLGRLDPARHDRDIWFTAGSAAYFRRSRSHGDLDRGCKPIGPDIAAPELADPRNAHHPLRT